MNNKEIKNKAYLKKAKARTFDTLIDANSRVLDTITASDIEDWATHCGYTL